MLIFMLLTQFFCLLSAVSETSDVTQMGIFILSNLLPTIYPILDKFQNICSAYYKTLNVFIESVVISSNEVRKQKKI